MTYVLIVLWCLGNSTYTGVAMQEFSTAAQCQYAVKLIKERGGVNDAFCIKK